METKIMLVEDNEHDVVIVTESLNRIQHQVNRVFRVAVAHTLGEAKLLIERVTFDAILLDLYLPDAERLDGLRELVALSPEVPIIVYSSVYSPELAEEAFAIGAQDFLGKEFSDESFLARAISHAIRRHERITMKLKELRGDWLKEAKAWLKENHSKDS